MIFFSSFFFLRIKLSGFMCKMCEGFSTVSVGSLMLNDSYMYYIFIRNYHFYSAGENSEVY